MVNLFLSYDFCKRLYSKDLNKRSIEILVQCGAFDNLGANRKQIFLILDSYINHISNE